MQSKQLTHNPCSTCKNDLIRIDIRVQSPTFERDFGNIQNKFKITKTNTYKKLKKHARVRSCETLDVCQTADVND